MSFDFLRVGKVGRLCEGLYNETIMNFSVQRLHTEEDSARRYHLFNGRGKLTLVADYGSPWLRGAEDAQRQVRFAWSSGELVATLDLPEKGERQADDLVHTSYALILDHAVYAIINAYQAGNEPDTTPYFTIEVEGMVWLVWGKEQDDALFTLYDQVPSNLAVSDNPLESGLIEPIGRIHRTQGDYDLTITLPDQRLHEAALLALALLFLIDWLDAGQTAVINNTSVKSLGTITIQ